jgi:maltooligosyltrehalose trehalohydrolase
MHEATRRLPAGAEVQAGGVHFRVWAPTSKRVAVLVGENELPPSAPIFPLEPEGDGYFSGLVEKVGTGALYKFRLDAGDFPDPFSRFQPQGPHGPSQVVDPGAYRWGDAAWRGVGREGQVVYEMHVGTFTPEGTWDAAAEQLGALAGLGITVLEVMPVAEFPGRFGWGYDGVDLFAPTRLYGPPDRFRAFVDRAHAHGIGVILDVVYNHFGPDGCYLRCFSPDYFTDRYENEWGDAINFDGPNNGPVREFFLANAGYWMEEFHLDGLRLDATQSIHDSSPEHILAQISRRVREAGKGRATYIINENEPQHVKLVKPFAEGGYGMDALWNDDFHHSAIVTLTGRSEAYYMDYRGTPQEFISMAKYGYLYQGQRYKWQKKRRGTPSLKLHPSHFVTFIQNHDQVANSLCGKRIHELASPGNLRAMTALMLLGPGTPMLFQGQEFAASSPFLYFADHNPELARMVAAGRRQFLEQFPSSACLGSELDRILAQPESEATFLRCKLDHSEREKNIETYRLHRDLLALRRKDPVLREPRRGGLDGAVLSDRALVLRFFGEVADDDRLLLVNFGSDLHLDPAPEPLLAPIEGRKWRTKWSSEDPAYAGCGTPVLETEENWRLPGQIAVLLEPA